MAPEDERKNDPSISCKYGGGRKALSRRSFLQCAVAFAYLLSGSAEAANAMNQQATASRRRFNVAVIGAGAFGGWTALHLLR
jgi:hypothetical protein